MSELCIGWDGEASKGIAVYVCITRGCQAKIGWVEISWLVERTRGI